MSYARVYYILWAWKSIAKIGHTSLWKEYDCAKEYS